MRPFGEDFAIVLSCWGSVGEIGGQFTGRLQGQVAMEGGNIGEFENARKCSLALFATQRL